MAVDLPLTGAGQSTAQGRTRSSAARSGAHVQAIDQDPPASADLSNVDMSDNATHQLVAANTARCRLTIVNDSNGVLLVKKGATATATSYSHRVAPGGELVLDPPCYQGQVDAILPNGAGAARMTEESYA